MRQMRLAIIIGHSKSAPGALAVAPINQHEYFYNTEVAQEMYRYARELGLDCCIFTRDDGGVKGAYARAREWAGSEPAVAIELHFNAANGKASGTETLYDAEPASNKEFAHEIQAAMCALFNRTGKQNRGAKLIERGDRGHANLAECTMIGCLVEPFFGDNKDDAELGERLKMQYARALVGAVKKYLAELNLAA